MNPCHIFCGNGASEGYHCAVCIRAIDHPAYCDHCNMPTIFKHTPDNSSENYQCTACNGFAQSLNYMPPSAELLPDPVEISTNYREDPRDSHIAQLELQLSKLKAKTPLAHLAARSDETKKQRLLQVLRITALVCFAISTIINICLALKGC